MNLKDCLNLGCYFCLGICAINALAVIGRMFPSVGLALVGILTVGAIALAVACRFYPKVAPSATFLAMTAIIGLVLGVVN